MTTNRKMTKRDYFNILRESYPTSANNYKDVIAFLDHELELLAKKNSGDKKPTKLQEANENIKDAIYRTLSPDARYTITDIIKTVPECAELTNQKVSALVNQMCPNRMERIVEKSKSYFRKIAQ